MPKIIGGTAASNMLIPDWNQTNPKRADYIKNKPNIYVPPLDIDPVFENNSWETIAEVARYGDPSKYWKVGDYKMVSFGATDDLVLLNSMKGLEEMYGGPCVAGNINGQVLVISDVNRFVEDVVGVSGSYTIKSGEGGSRANPYTIVANASGSVVWEGDYDNLSIDITDDISEPDEWTVEIGREEAKCFLQIIGFNHDKVANPYEYGKQRAGMTLQFGVSRHITGDLIPTLYSPILEGVMASDGIHYKSPCRTVYDGDSGEYVDRRTNWKDCAFRTSLNTILVGSSLEDLVVPVQKYTSQYYKSSNHYSASMLTEDRVFLPSEYEVFGEVVNAPCKEGEQYEFYKDGYSKFIWSEELLTGTVTNGRLWLRSAKGADVNESTPDSVSACSVYMSVTSRPDDAGDGAKVNYQPAAAASNSSAAYIAPCICL